MNDENRFGWHQNDGMTYIYDRDDMYTENFWNTVNRCVFREQRLQL